MLSVDQIEQKIIKYEDFELIEYLWELKLLKREVYCGACGISMSIRIRKENIDKYAWRCINKICGKYKNYKSVRVGSFFEAFKLEIKFILRVVLKFISKQSQYSINEYFSNKSTSIKKIIKKFYSLIPEYTVGDDKFGGYGNIVQIDETMLNYKCKSHRGRSSSNRTDALCIVEVRHGIKRAYACIIPNKESATLIPIIQKYVYSGSVIWTDEHRSYGKLKELFRHSTVCHKYEFINSLNGSNTQAVESFNNELKLQIKREKGIFTTNRNLFLKRFIFFFNNSENLLNACLCLIKV